MQDSSVVARVWKIADPIVSSEGLEIVDIEYHNEGRGPVLRVFIDREGGVNLDDLTRISRQLSDVLDVHDTVSGHYTLECSSPGINRRLRLPQHFARYLGQRVRLKLAIPEQGRRGFVGQLNEVNPEALTLTEDNGEQHQVRFANIARANHEPEETPGGKPCSRS